MIRWLFLLLASVASSSAHDLPIGYVDLHLTGKDIDVTIEASARNFTRELGGLEEATLLEPAGIERIRDRLLAGVAARLTISANGATLTPTVRAIETLPVRKDLRLRLTFSGLRTDEKIHVHCELFSFDLRHRTFFNVYDAGGTLRYRDIFDRETTEIEYQAGRRQALLDVVKQFLREGIHHIFIGPDHILFIIGLLLLGGSLGQLLRIVTAFTLAHSVTLVLATLNILSPPPRLIEPAIALSIIFVGAHALLQRTHERDWRLLFAFGFGFVHGFGFANVLREMALPRAALGWSLFAFNGGVEIGQACIVLTVAPLLALVSRHTGESRKPILASAFLVVVAGSFWFVQRVWP